MRVLVLGGTKGIGLAVAETLAALGHHVISTGRSAVRGVPVATEVSHYEAPEARLFEPQDAVVDVVSGKPWSARANIEMAKNFGLNYISLSSTAVYESLEEPNCSESSPVRSPLFHEAEFNAINYGRWKRANEIALFDLVPDATVLRLGVITGPTDAQMKSLVSLIKGKGRFDLPDAPGESLQILDARDIGTFIDLCLTEARPGIYNVVPDIGSQTWERLLRSLGAGPERVNWRSYEYLAKNGARVLLDPPFWMPRFGVGTGFFAVSNTKATDLGWRTRSLEDSASWYLS